MKVIFFLTLFISSHSYAINCEWWQIKVRSHQVDQHRRNSSNVNSHSRKEHCREKWNLADLYIKRIVDSRPEGWHHQKENYKPWLILEKEVVLKVLSAIPNQYQMENFYLYRSQNSVTKGNPASIHIDSRSITLYDNFFNQKNKDSILVHESAHYHFSQLNESQRDKFFELSGWKKIITNDGPKLHPPKNLIKEDSHISPEEDFSNYSEIYYESPEKLKSFNPQIYQYFEERYRP